MMTFTEVTDSIAALDKEITKLTGKLEVLEKNTPAYEDIYHTLLRATVEREDLIGLYTEMKVKRLEKLNKWFELKEKADAAKEIIEEEQTMRKEIFALFFESPSEGVNKFDIGDDYCLKGTYKLERKIDESVLQATLEQMEALGHNPNSGLIVMQPKLVLEAYRSLTPELQAIFSKALTIKEGSPQLEIADMNKKRKKANKE